MHLLPYLSIIVFRGEILFQQKAENCEASNAAGAIIYNNVPGLFAGTLTPGNSIKIPIAGVSQEDGQKLLKEAAGSQVELRSQKGYGFNSGTSMVSIIIKECEDCW